MPMLSKHLHAYKGSPEFNNFLDRACKQLVDAAQQEAVRQKREDPFQRLVTHPMTEAFEAGELSREILPNYFSFLHLVLGDTRDTLTARCVTILRQLKEKEGLNFTWDLFYEDPRAKEVLWSVLVRVAESFRRFDARRDWFIALMQNRPQAISLGPNAFKPKPPSEESHPFGLREFAIMFNCLFQPLRKPTVAEAVLFERVCGARPEKLLGPIFAQLEAAAASV